jgi:hypothetical protein
VTLLSLSILSTVAESVLKTDKKSEHGSLQKMRVLSLLVLGHARLAVGAGRYDDDSLSSHGCIETSSSSSGEEL